MTGIGCLRPATRDSLRLVRILSLAEYVDRLKRGTLRRVATGLRCPSCGGEGAIHIRTRGRRVCADCAPSTRVCTHCDREKPLTAFDVSKHATLGLKIEGHCVSCRRESQRAEYKRKMATGHPPVASKECRTCGQTKPSSAFYRDGRYLDGLLSDCKSCLNEKKTELRGR